MKTAKYIKNIKNWNGVACLYELSHAVKYQMRLENFQPHYNFTNYIIVSSVNVFDKPETYAFPATQDGEPITMHELDFSMHGTLSHQEVLDNGGFEIEGYCPDIYT